ncbi:MAG TPA: hypothetical protein VLK29_07835 [Luteimonas sp.]|nr:hypothetical protein [Luteimonas sp.]
MTKRHALFLATCVCLAAAPLAHAQESGPVLRVDGGTVMTSTGGEFVSTDGGNPVQPGDRVMLAEGGRATLVYPDNCTQPLTEAGVYTVAPGCIVASPAPAVRSNALVIGGVVALAAVAALASGGGGDDNPPPPPPPPPPVSR